MEASMSDKRLDPPYWALRIAFGVVPIVAGIDKFTNLLVDWRIYVSPFFARLLPIAPGAFLHLAGVVEVVVGVTVLAGFTRFGGYAAAAWLAAIVVNLLTSGTHLDVAARDAVMVIAAWTLGRLTEIRAPHGSEEKEHGGHGGHAHAPA
jgi:uncharacterized membrane protein YphA (DoxX/SURF4 family)